MDPDLLLIFGFITVIVAMSLIAGYAISRREQAHKERKLELETRLAEAKAAQAGQVTADYRRFEDRLRVLERIATDGNHALAVQIDELRSLDLSENPTLKVEQAS